MASRDQLGNGWTVVLRRRPARMIEGRPEGGYTDLFEIICCDCRDHPDPDYREVSPVLQRGPRPIPDRRRHYRVCDAPPAAPPARTC